MIIDGRKLMMARAEKGWNISDLADQSGVNRKTISEMERDNKSVRATTLSKVAQSLDKPLHFFEMKVNEDILPEISNENELMEIVINEIMANISRVQAEHGSGFDYDDGKWLSLAGEEFGEICQSLQVGEDWIKETDKTNKYGEIIDLITVLVRWGVSVKAKM